MTLDRDAEFKGISRKLMGDHGGGGNLWREVDSSERKTAFVNRLMERHKHIIQKNSEHIKGKRVLDLASHNGRWTYAALKADAEFVFGVEGRQTLINADLEEFERFPKESYQFECGNVYDAKAICAKCGYASFDTILCLGLFYHISDHYHLIRVMRSFNPTCIIIDGSFLQTSDKIVKYKIEDNNNPAMAISEGVPEISMAGIASLGFLRAACKISGYKIDIIPWTISDPLHYVAVKDYLEEKPAQRMTLRLTALPDKPTW